MMIIAAKAMLQIDFTAMFVAGIITLRAWSLGALSNHWPILLGAYRQLIVK